MSDGDTTAPELTDSLTWLNSRPVSLSAQEGKVVALLFWSAGSAWSHNLLDRFSQLQARFQRELQVIGIHCPKFEAERDTDTVRRAVATLGPVFPVAHDPDFVTWQHYEVNAWPSTVLLDPHGNVRGQLRGEVGLEALEGVLRSLFAEVPPGNGKAEPVSDVWPGSVLLQAGGIAVGERMLYVADTGHHRILECDHGGRIQRVFGTGIADLTDGRYAESAFRQPTGLALTRGMLYVADTGNHALRRIGLERGEVDTLLGNGQAGNPQDGPVGDPRSIQLDRPTGLAVGPDRLFLALSGTNQIWEYQLSDNRLRCLAGSGELAVADGTGEQAAFAQPASLALVQQTLYVADAAASALRSIHTGTGAVHLLVGKGLFDFGNQDGKRKEASLQYPTGLALDPASPYLWVADSYNGLVRRLKLGGGGLARVEVGVPLVQPRAITCADGAMWLADAAADAVVRIDLGSGEATRIPITE